MDEISDILNFTHLKANHILAKLDGTKRDDKVSFFSILILDRLNLSCIGLIPLVSELEKNKGLEYSCSLILRAILLDSLILYNAIEILQKESIDDSQTLVELENYCDRMLHEGVIRCVSHFKQLRIPPPILKVMYSELVKEYPYLFEPYNNDGNPPIPVLKMDTVESNGKLFNNLFDSQEMNLFSSLYDAYLFYSKYDHFGVMYYDFSNHSWDTKIGRMTKTMRTLPKTLLFAASILIGIKGMADLLSDDFNEIKNYLDFQKENSGG